MEINVNNNQIQIHTTITDEIYPYIYSQIKFYGFVKINSETFIKNCLYLENDLNEIVTYLKLEQIDFNLTDSSNQIIQKFKTITSLMHS